LGSSLTAEGKENIKAMLEATAPGAKPGQWRIEGNATSENGVISSWFTFETAVSKGKGQIRLKDGKCWTLLTTMTELKGCGEKKGASRPKGVQHGAFPNRQTWLERKTQEAAELGVTKQPYHIRISAL
jgi:putative flavoprotein involved in K+ transport